MILNILKATRPINLFILFTAQVLTVYFLGFKNSWGVVFNISHLAVYITTLLCAMFGYLLNDYFDNKADTINKPDSSYLESPGTRTMALILSLVSASAAILIGFVIVFKLGVLITLVISLLFLYNVFLKRLPIIGNLVIAMLGAFSIFILMVFDANLNRDLILIFSLNAFGIHFIREIIKDTQDMGGDAIAGYRTFPLLAGIKATRILLIFVLFIYILIVTTCVRLIMLHYFSGPLSYIFLTYNVLCVGVPLFHLLSQLQQASEKTDFAYLSQVALYIMVTGTLSMLFF